MTIILILVSLLFGGAPADTSHVEINIACQFNWLFVAGNVDGMEAQSTYVHPGMADDPLCVGGRCWTSATPVTYLQTPGNRWWTAHRRLVRGDGVIGELQTVFVFDPQGRQIDWRNFESGACDRRVWFPVVEVSR
jgi:hypothetical protein